MKSGKTCSPSRRKPGESLFVRIEANLTGQQNFVVKYNGESRPSGDRAGGGGGWGGRIRDKAGGGLKTFFRASVWSKNKGGPCPSSGFTTEIDLLALYVLFS